MLKKIMSAIIIGLLACTSMVAFSDNALPVSAVSYSYSTGSYSIGISGGSRMGSNVRKGPDTSYKKVGAASYGVTFYVERVSNEWGYTSSIRTTTGTKSGWVNLNYCTLINSDSSSVQNSDNTISSVSTGSLNFDAMYDYAYTYWKNYNTSQYRSYKSDNVDCQNFVSQILVAGGVPQTADWHGSYDYSDVTSSFTYSPDFIGYFRNTYQIPYYNRTKLSWDYKDGSSFSISDIEPGDVITSYGTYGRNHVMMVLGKSGNYVRFTAHTNDRFYGLNGGSIHISEIDGLLKTSQIKLDDNSSQPSANVLYGDVNGDSKISITDLVQLQNYVTNPVEFPLNNPSAADVNLDGIVNQQDVDILQRYLVKLISSLPYTE